MKKLSLSGISAIAGIAMAAGMSAGANAINARPPVGPVSIRHYRKSGVTYPEQSSRQAMRGSRRQQGGPGIVLNAKTFQYVEVAPLTDLV